MRNYSTQPKTIIVDNPFDGSNTAEPDKLLIATLHKLLDYIPDDNLALAIDATVADLLRVNRRPDGQFDPELISGGGAHHD